MSMPKKDPYNTQQVIASLRFFIENGYCWERFGGLDQMFVKKDKIRYVMSMLPPGGGRNSVDPRFITQCTTYVM
jgi:dynein heavy chain